MSRHFLGDLIMESYQAVKLMIHTETGDIVARFSWNAD